MVLSAAPISTLLGLDIGAKASAYCFNVPEIEAKLAQLASSGKTKVGSPWAKSGCWTFVRTISNALYGVPIDSTQGGC